MQSDFQYQGEKDRRKLFSQNDQNQLQNICNKNEDSQIYIDNSNLFNNSKDAKNENEVSYPDFQDSNINDKSQQELKMESHFTDLESQYGENKNKSFVIEFKKPPGFISHKLIKLQEVEEEQQPKQERRVNRAYTQNVVQNKRKISSTDSSDTESDYQQKYKGARTTIIQKLKDDSVVQSNILNKSRARPSLKLSQADALKNFDMKMKNKKQQLLSSKKQKQSQIFFMNGSVLNTNKNQSQLVKKSNRESVINNSGRNGSVSFLDFYNSQYQINQIIQESQDEHLIDDTQIKSKENSVNIKVFLKVVRFIAILKENSQLLNYKCMQQRQFKLINDVTSYKKGLVDVKQAYISIIQSKWHKLLKCVKVFKPQSLLIQFWKIIMLIQVILQTIIIPLKFSFELKFSDEALQNIFYRIPFVLLLFDILIHFNTGYYYQGTIVLNRKKIVRNYVRFNFWIDLITTMSLIFSDTDKQTGITDLIFLLRTQWIPTYATQIIEHFQLAQSQRFISVFNLVKLLFMISIFAHFFGCGFHYIAQQQIQEGEQNTWLQYYNFQDLEWYNRYLECIYYAFITATSVGYGDISPQTNIEKLYVIGFTLVSCMQFAYAVNLVGSIFIQIQERKENFRKQQLIMSNYMQSRNIDKFLQIRVLKYLHYLHKKDTMGHEQGENLLNQMSFQLRKEVKQEYYQKILLQNNFFAKTFCYEAIQEISQYMKEIMVAPGENLFQENDNDQRLFIIREGEVEAYIEKKANQNTKVLAQYQKNDIFGLEECLSLQPRSYSVRSTVITAAVYISLEDIKLAIEHFKEDREHFNMIKDLMAYSQCQYMTRCIICQSFNHTTLKCQLVFFSPKKLILNLKNAHYVLQERSNFKRKKLISRANALQNQQIINLQGRISILVRLYEFTGGGIKTEHYQKYLNMTDKQFCKKVTKIVYNHINYEDSKHMQSELKISQFMDSVQENSEEDDYEYTSCSSSFHEGSQSGQSQSQSESQTLKQQNQINQDITAKSQQLNISQDVTIAQDQNLRSQDNHTEMQKNSIIQNNKFEQLETMHNFQNIDTISVNQIQEPSVIRNSNSIVNQRSNSRLSKKLQKKNSSGINDLQNPINTQDLKHKLFLEAKQLTIAKDGTSPMKSIKPIKKTTIKINNVNQVTSSIQQNSQQCQDTCSSKQTQESNQNQIQKLVNAQKNIRQEEKNNNRKPTLTRRQSINYTMNFNLNQNQNNANQGQNSPLKKHQNDMFMNYNVMQEQNKQDSYHQPDFQQQQQKQSQYSNFQKYLPGYKKKMNQSTIDQFPSFKEQQQSSIYSKKKDSRYYNNTNPNYMSIRSTRMVPQRQKQIQTQFFQYDMDSVYLFKKYFPKFNYDNVCNNLRQMIRTKQLQKFKDKQSEIKKNQESKMGNSKQQQYKSRKKI